MVDERTISWRPGSFSKNFSWGQTDGSGLAQLHQAIRVGFNNSLQPVLRDTFRTRVRSSLHVPDLIAVNFFLFNYVQNDQSWLAVDELVLKALSDSHDSDFDMLAIFALNFSKVGKWKGAREFQRYPALWAKYLIIDHVYQNGGWDAEKIDADFIESYLKKHMAYGSERPRKFATNLNDIYRRARIRTLVNSEKESWWGDSVFLALDRLILDLDLDVVNTTNRQLVQLLDDAQFWQLTAISPMKGRMAASELVDLYLDSDGPNRFPSGRDRSSSNDANLQPSNSERNDGRQAILKNAGAVKPVARIFAVAQRQSRNRKHVAFLKRLYRHRCSICDLALKIGVEPLRFYSEVGHVKPVGKPFEGPDHLSNMLVFCPNHHKAFDFGGVVIKRNGETLTVASQNGESTIDGRRVRIDSAHSLNLDFIDWHAKLFEA